MSPKDTPYPFDDVPDENYFGEFRELLSSIGQYGDKKGEKKDKENIHGNPDNRRFDDTFNEFSIFPKD